MYFLRNPYHFNPIRFPFVQIILKPPICQSFMTLQPGSVISKTFWYVFVFVIPPSTRSTETILYMVQSFFHPSMQKTYLCWLITQTQRFWRLFSTTLSNFVNYKILLNISASVPEESTLKPAFLRLPKRLFSVVGKCLSWKICMMWLPFFFHLKNARISDTVFILYRSSTSGLINRPLLETCILGD